MLWLVAYIDHYQQVSYSCQCESFPPVWFVVGMTAKIGNIINWTAPSISVNTFMADMFPFYDVFLVELLGVEVIDKAWSRRF